MIVSPKGRVWMRQLSKTFYTFGAVFTKKGSFKAVPYKCKLNLFRPNRGFVLYSGNCVELIMKIRFFRIKQVFYWRKRDEV